MLSSLDIHSLRIETTYRIGSADRIASPRALRFGIAVAAKVKGLQFIKKTPTQSPSECLGFKLELAWVYERVNISSNWSI